VERAMERFMGARDSTGRAEEGKVRRS